MAISSPTNFVANPNQPSEFVACGTMFAAHMPATELWTTNADSRMHYFRPSAFDPSVTQELKDMSVAWRSVLSDFSGLVAPTTLESLRAATSTAFAEVGLALRSSLRDALLGATTATGELSRTAVGSAAEASTAGQEDDAFNPTEGDRRLYALAAIDKLQRLLRVNQDETSALVRVSRPTLWNWQQGRVPQERSLRHLHNVAAAVDLLVDAVGGEAQFDPVRVATILELDASLTSVLSERDGPKNVLTRLFAESRRNRRISLMPDANDLDEPEIEQFHAVIEQPPPQQRRKVRRRARD